MKQSDLAYIAGLFDGEGSIQVQKYQASKNKRWYWRLVARIANTDIRCLEFVRDTLGFGWVGLSSRASAHKASHASKDCYQYCVTNRTVETFVKLLRPYLIVKAEKVDQLMKTRHTGAVDQYGIIDQSKWGTF